MKHGDGHVHSSATLPEDAGELLRAMDRNDCEFLVLISPDPRQECWHGGPLPADGRLLPVAPEIRRQTIEATARLVKQAPDRLYGFAWLDPEFPEADAELERACDLGFVGVKMIPRGWYPSETRFRPLFARIEELRLRMLFHTGILWSFGDTSRFCRPTHLEFLTGFPGIRFMMAHGSWPWIDECIAVALKFLSVHEARKLPGEAQALIDTTRGTPPIYRRMLLERAAAVVGVERMVYGSDHRSDTIDQDAGWRDDLRLIREELAWTEAQTSAYLRGNLARFLGRS
jgi:predicted TIM-barrel fold metal-dependent hydrolase